MIDLHLHLLPEIDDGSSSLQMSRAMLESLARQGVTRVVATPHLMQPLTDDYHHLALSLLDQIRPLAATHGVSVDLGYEHLLAPGLAARLHAGEPSNMAGGSAVLVELPFVGWPWHAESSLFALRVAGFTPILAHPERYLEVQKQPELALVAGEQGTVLQLTSGSFTGVYGKAVERSARHLLAAAIERDIPVVLASDAHSDGHRLSSVPEGLQWIRRKVEDGDLVVEWANGVVPSKLLQSEPVPPFQRWAQTAARPGGSDRRSRPPLWKKALGLAGRSGRG
ncbi:MAG: hypothetical protein H0T72_07220 [Chloroflexia bacterium]|nr:hypothetical protein [Chloroflexia bacterium]